MNESLRPSFFTGCSGDMTPRDRRNQRRFTALLFIWALLFLAATYAIAADWVAPGSLAWFVAAVPSLFALVPVMAYIHFLREGDELLRAIHLRALALTLGVGFVLWPAYELFGRLGYPMEPWDTVPIITMAITYSAAVLLGERHYK